MFLRYEGWAAGMFTALYNKFDINYQTLKSSIVELDIAIAAILVKTMSKWGIVCDI